MQEFRSRRRAYLAGHAAIARRLQEAVPAQYLRRRWPPAASRRKGSATSRGEIEAHDTAAGLVRIEPSERGLRPVRRIRQVPGFGGKASEVEGAGARLAGPVTETRAGSEQRGRKGRSQVANGETLILMRVCPRGGETGTHDAKRTCVPRSLSEKVPSSTSDRSNRRSRARPRKLTAPIRNPNRPPAMSTRR